MKEKPIWEYVGEMADVVFFKFLHSELVSYILANSEKDKTVINKCYVSFCFGICLSDELCAENSTSDYWWFVQFRTYRIFNWLQDNWKVSSTYMPAIVVDVNKPLTMAQVISNQKS
jgi:hypothetical protein